jgi:hypothetical protein
LCAEGNPVNIIENTSTGAYEWQCVGMSGGDTVSCSSAEPSAPEESQAYVCLSTGAWYSPVACDAPPQYPMYNENTTYTTNDIVCVPDSSPSPDIATCLQPSACVPPVITQSDFTLTEYLGVNPGSPNGVFNLDFDESLYVNARIQVFIGTTSITSTAETNLSPASGGIFGNTTYNIRLNVDCISNGNNVNSNFIEVVGSVAPNNSNTCNIANQVWVDGSSFVWNTASY